MLWVKIDASAPTHPKMLKAGPAACWLWVASLCYCQTHKTDGFLPVGSLSALVPLRYPSQSARALVAAGMWEEVDGGWKVHDYADYQQTRAVIEANKAHISSVRSVAGKHGAAVRWKKGDGKDGKPIATENAIAEQSIEEEGKTHVAATLTTKPTKSNGHPRSHVFCGKRFCVPQFIHDQFDRQLGDGGPAFDLLGWYVELDARDNEPVADLLGFLRVEFGAAVKAQFGDAKQQRRRQPAATSVWDTCTHIPNCGSTRECETKTLLDNARAQP